MRLMAVRGDVELWGDPEDPEAPGEVVLPDGRRQGVNPLSLLKVGYWELPKGEAKHPGPGGAPTHSTGTPQGAHGGGRDIDVSVALFDGLYEVVEIAPIFDRARTAVEGALASGELSGEPLQQMQTVHGALDDLQEVVQRASAEDPVEGLLDAPWVTYVEWVEVLTERLEQRRVDPGTALRLKTLAEVHVPRARTALLELQDPDRDTELSETLLRLTDKNPASTRKKEVMRAIVDDWEARGEDPRAVSAMAADLRHTQRFNDETDREYMERVAQDFVAAWASTSNDTNRASLITQDAAEAAFPDQIKDPSGWEVTVNGPDPVAAGLAQSTLQDMHRRTQEWFAERGIEKVTLYRGQREYAIIAPGVDPDEEGGRLSDDGFRDLLLPADRIDVGGTEAIRLRPLSSWSSSLAVASSFGTHDGMGTLAMAEVPVERILCHPGTGLGCLKEQEFVVLGGEIDVEWTYRNL